VAVTTTLGAQPFPGGGADGASAVALQTLVRIAALEYGARGLRANAIAAGWREGELPAELDPALARSDTPTGRLGSADDLAGAVAWLLSPDAEHLNGEVLHLDGGYTISRGARPDPRTV
jgi:NAD(P)-dependent dehydrogenase (short-subunit alcohol dehydrogenase family)